MKVFPLFLAGILLPWCVPSARADETAAEIQEHAEQARLAWEEARWSQTLVAFTERSVPARVPFNAVLEEFGIEFQLQDPRETPWYATF